MGTRGPIPDKHSRWSELRKLFIPESAPSVTDLRTGLRHFPPPDNLTEEARAFWLRNAPFCVQCGLLHQAVLDAFSELCRAWSEIRRLSDVIENEGYVVESKRGGEKLHPKFRARMELDRKFLRLAGDFGLTPAGRARHGLPTELATPGVDPFG